MKHPRLVVITWEDASVVDDGTWVARADLPPAHPIVFQQAGWLLEITPEHVVMTACLGEGLMSARDRIPRGMVRSIIQFDPAFGEPFKMPRKRKRS
jgi:hypothetical protein